MQLHRAQLSPIAAARRLCLLAICITSFTIGGACSRERAPSDGSSASSMAAPAAVPSAASSGLPPPAASFINKVWQVEESTGVAPGALYVLMAEGSLLIASPDSRPALGSWKYEGERLTLVEEGIDYPVDVLELSENRFRIRMHSPGQPVEITFVPARSPPPDSHPDRRY